MPITIADPITDQLKLQQQLHQHHLETPMWPPSSHQTKCEPDWPDLSLNFPLESRMLTAEWITWQGGIDLSKTHMGYLERKGGTGYMACRTPCIFSCFVPTPNVQQRSQMMTISMAYLWQSLQNTPIGLKRAKHSHNYSYISEKPSSYQDCD